MALESKTELYDKGVELGEAGKYEEALESFKGHLKLFGKDSQAWNDCGAVLYCLGRVDEAIEHFEKATEHSSESEGGEIYWNLCEAYIDAGRGTLAAGLFDKMEHFEILSPDVINRVANCFLQQEYFGSAVEMLLRSLEMIPNQEILRPMVDIIRSKRAKVAFFGGSEIEGISAFADKRFITEVCQKDSLEEVRKVMEWADMAWIAGCDEVVREVCSMPKVCEIIVQLGIDDVYNGPVEEINWANVDTLVLPASRFVAEAISDRVENIADRVKIVQAGPCVDTSNIHIDKKGRGKRIASVGPINLRSNPMQLLQCMQKLHYIDSDYRLYIAGEFEDKSVEHYVKDMVEQLDLSSVVFFDGAQDNLDGWLRDKHYVVSTSIDESGLWGVLEGAGRGLKPVVGRFAGAEDIFDGQFLFSIAEDFCEQIVGGDFQPDSYRKMAEQGYSYSDQMKELCEILNRIEKDTALYRKQRSHTEQLRRPLEQQNQLDIIDLVPQMQESEPVIGQPIMPTPTEPMPIMPAQMEPMPITPIIPAVSDGLANPINMPAFSPIEPDDSVTINGQSIGDFGGEQAKPKGAIERMAEEVMRSCRAITEQPDVPAGEPAGSNWSEQAEGTDLSQMGHGSVDASVEQDVLSKMAAEFSSTGIEAEADSVNQMETHQIPFTS